MHVATINMKYFSACTVHLLLFLFQPTNAYIYIYHNTVSLYNVHSYMFQHLCVILREFQFFWNCNFNSISFENLCNLARHNKIETP